MTVTLPASAPLRLVLPREATVSGIVLAPSGAPAAGARLVVGRSEGRGFRFMSDEERLTDPEGRFEIDELSPGVTTLQASAAGFAPSELVSLELAAGEPVVGVQLALRIGGMILGELVGSDGGPLTDRTVWVSAAGYNAHPETDAEGRFQVTGVPPGEVRLSADSSEGIQLQERVKVAEGETVRVRLAAPSRVVRLHGRVLAGGEPLPQANLYAYVRREEASEARSSARAETDGEGAFELALPGPGRYSISVSRWGEAMLNWSATVEVPVVESFAFDISIPLGRISGRVTDAHGTPLAGLHVQSQPEQHEDGSHGSARAVTDAEGRYELSVPAGRHAVQAGGNSQRAWRDEPSEYAEARVGGLVVSAGGSLRGVDLRLERGGILTGIVRDPDGSPAARAKLWRENGARFELFGQCDEGGRFEVQGLVPGPLLLGVNSADGATREPVPVEVVTAEAQRVEIVLSSATPVRLSVRQRGEAVGSEITVEDERGARHPLLGTGKGEARLGPLVAGRYTVRAQRDGKTVERAFEVTADAQELALELVFE